MNLGTINLIIGSVAGVVGILVYLWKGVRYNNKARSKAQSGRIIALVQIVEIQGERLTTLETYLSKEDGGNYTVNSSLMKLEEKALQEYKNHDTNLT